MPRFIRSQAFLPQRGQAASCLGSAATFIVAFCSLNISSILCLGFPKNQALAQNKTAIIVNKIAI